MFGNFFRKDKTSESKPKSEKKETVLSKEKQRELEKYCEKLFTKKDLIAAGKLQFLGLNLIQKKLGKSWDGLKPIVFQTAEEAIKKYLLPHDIFIRYKEDTYVIIFEKSDPNEALVKARLIVEEIKKQLFDHEEKALRDIEIEETVSVIKTENIKTTKNIVESIKFETRPSKTLINKDDKKKVVPPPTIEIDPFEDSNKTDKNSSDNKSDTGNKLNYSYIPLWDTSKNILSTYVCLPYEGKQKPEDAFDSYEYLFSGRNLAFTIDTDLEVIRHVRNELAEMAEGQWKFFIVCPVHYETLTKDKSNAKYIVECQKIPDDQKKYLIFLVTGLPKKLQDRNAEKYFAPLKNHCISMFAQVPLNLSIDFFLLQKWHFDTVGVRLKQTNRTETKTIEMLNKFSHKVQNTLIKKLFLMDVKSLSITTSAVCAGYHLLSGDMIHEAVRKPDKVFRFAHQDLFADLIVEKQEE